MDVMTVFTGVLDKQLIFVTTSSSPTLRVPWTKPSIIKSVALSSTPITLITPRIQLDSASFFFPNKKSNNTEPYKKLNNRGYQVIVNKMQKMANIEMRITPHTFRHTMATFALRSGMAPECIQQILGHNDVGLTLRVYAKVAQTEVEHSYRKLVS